MKWRGFIGAIGALGAALAVPSVEALAQAKPDPKVYRAVERANGKNHIVGVAMETVYAGDLVQIQTHGKAHVFIAEDLIRK